MEKFYKPSTFFGPRFLLARVSFSNSRGILKTFFRGVFPVKASDVEQNFGLQGTNIPTLIVPWLYYVGRRFMNILQILLTIH